MNGGGIQRLGLRSLDFVGHLGRLGIFVLQVLRAGATPRYRVRLFLNELFDVGADLCLPPADGEPQPDVGLRTFDEINASMSAVTGISTQNADVKTTFDTIRQQLPTVVDIEAFLSSHQVAVAQLAIEYCNALVDNGSARAAYFPGFNFGAPAAQAFDTVGERNLIIDPLFANVVGSGLATQPDDADVRAELNDLMDRLTACGNGCAADRTATVVKATCAALLGSGATLLQ